jgi:hypothetical protein
MRYRSSLATENFSKPSSEEIPKTFIDGQHLRAYVSFRCKTSKTIQELTDWHNAEKPYNMR